MAGRRMGRHTRDSKIMNWLWGKKVFSVPDQVVQPVTVGTPDTGKLDENSESWRYVKSWAEGELENLRKQNDSASLDDMKTAVIRGEIKILKKLIVLPETLLSRETRLARSNRLNTAGDDEDD